jgi:hypothetical protein
VPGEGGRSAIKRKLVLAIVLQIPLDLKVRKPETMLFALRLQIRPLKSFAYSARANKTDRLIIILRTLLRRRNNKLRLAGFLAVNDACIDHLGPSPWHQVAHLASRYLSAPNSRTIGPFVEIKIFAKSKSDLEVVGSLSSKKGGVSISMVRRWNDASRTY